MKIQWIEGKSDVSPCFLIRKKVFVTEQGFSEQNEFDEIDESAWHLLLSDNNQPIATARLYLEESEWHLGRICILKEYRKRGLGLMIMQAAEQKARELHAAMLSLSAQVRAKEFYQKAGYSEIGEEYLDEFCPHIRMQKRL